MGVIINGLMVRAEDAFMSFDEFMNSIEAGDAERDSRPAQSDTTDSPTRAAVDPVVQ